MNDDGHFEENQGVKRSCVCGRGWKKHCGNPRCKWLKCSNPKCSGTYDHRRRRFWCLKRDLPAA